MPAITEEEKLRRRLSIESVIGTNAMEGISLDAPTLALMHRYQEGEIDLDQMSSGIDLHVQSMGDQSLSGSANLEPVSVDAA